MMLSNSHPNSIFFANIAPVSTFPYTRTPPHSTTSETLTMNYNFVSDLFNLQPSPVMDHQRQLGEE
jgi:hypothetical protein